MRSIAFTILLATGMTACSHGQDRAVATTDGAHKVISIEEFAGRPADIQLLDVRTPGEWQAGVIDGALLCNIYSPDFENCIAELNTSKPVYVYCAVGGRSANAAEKMKKLGFKVFDLRGGMDAWKAKGKSTVPCPNC